MPVVEVPVPVVVAVVVVEVVVVEVVVVAVAVPVVTVPPLPPPPPPHAMTVPHIANTRRPVIASRRRFLLEDLIKRLTLSQTVASPPTFWQDTHGESK